MWVGRVHGFVGSQAGRAGAGARRSRLLRSCNARPVQMTARGASPRVRAYPVTRPGLLMAQATLPGLLSVLRPVVVPTRSCRLHRLTPHCERAPARMNPAYRDVPRGGSAKNPQQLVRPGR